MRRDRFALRLAIASLALTAATAVWATAVAPSRWPSRLAAAAFLPALWAYVELAQFRKGDDAGRAIMTWHRYTIAWAGFLVTSQLAFAAAIGSGLLEPSADESARRLGGLIVGSGMFLWGNRLPTLRSPWAFSEQPFSWQRVHRFAGWVFTVAGLGICAAWTVLPGPAAWRTSQGILVWAMALAVGRKLVSVAARFMGRPAAS